MNVLDCKGDRFKEEGGSMSKLDTVCVGLLRDSSSIRY